MSDAVDHRDTEAMSCEDCEALLPLVADGALDAEGEPALFAHLADCPRCQESLAAHDLVALALGEAPPAPRRDAIAFPLARMWMGMAAALLVAVALAAVWGGSQRGGASPALAQQELIEVIDPGTGATRQVLLIRQGDRSTVIDGDALDRIQGDQPVREADARPVRFRY